MHNTLRPLSQNCTSGGALYSGAQNQKLGNKINKIHNTMPLVYDI